MEETENNERVRIAKLIASRGLASRREAEGWIAEGRVKVNGVVIDEPGTTVHPTRDFVKVDDKPLPAAPPKVYFLLYKPKGYITGRDDPEGRKSVLEFVEDLKVRVEPVGRLDCDTEGALLLTNDGDLAHKLTHPSSEVPRRYLAKIWRVPDEQTMERLTTGKVHLEDGWSTPCKVRVAEATDQGNCWLEITVTEGRNRYIRRLLEAVNHPVSKLRRESFASISVRGMERGDLRPLTVEEVQRLRAFAEGEAPRKAENTRGKGFAKPKPPKVKPLHKKKKAAARAGAAANPRAGLDRNPSGVKKKKPARGGAVR